MRRRISLPSGYLWLLVNSSTFVGVITASAWRWLLDGAPLMKFLSNKTDPQSAEDLAFAERLNAIANRGRGIVKPEPAAEFQPSLAATEREQQFLDPSDLPVSAQQSAAA